MHDLNCSWSIAVNHAHRGLVLLVGTSSHQKQNDCCDPSHDLDSNFTGDIKAAELVNGRTVAFPDLNKCGQSVGFVYGADCLAVGPAVGEDSVGNRKQHVVRHRTPHCVSGSQPVGRTFAAR